MLPINGLVSRWRTQRIAGVVIAAWLCIAPSYAEYASPSMGFRRGIAVSHVMGWAPLKPAPPRDFVFPPFENSVGTFGSELKSIRRTGFDFVRLAVDPGPFLQFQGSQRDYLDDMLMDRVKLILSSGLSVVVDFHPSDLHPDYTAMALTHRLDAPIFQAYMRLLGRTATLLDRLQSDRVALEIMNEPPVTPGQWQPMLDAAYNGIRERAPHLLLILDGGDEGSAEGTIALGKFSNDPATLLSFHYYDPYQFTHQAAPWVAARYLADVPYPALARPLQDSLKASAALIAASDIPSSQKSLAALDARQRLEAYRRSSFDRSTIAKNFDRITRWARDLRMSSSRIILGEFGTRKQDGLLGAMRNAERARWIRDVREEAEARGFVWAAWVYRGTGGFSLLRNEQGTDLDPAVIEALGLDGRCAASTRRHQGSEKC
jgi:endoglucanase